MKVDHVGVVVRSILVPRAKFLAGFRQETDVIADPLQRVKVQFWINDQGDRIELIEPLGKKSPAYPSLKKGGGTNHLGFRCQNITRTLAKVRKDGGIILSKPAPAAGHHGRLIAFVFHPLLGLVEFIQWP